MDMHMNVSVSSGVRGFRHPPTPPFRRSTRNEGVGGLASARHCVPLRPTGERGGFPAHSRRAVTAHTTDPRRRFPSAANRPPADGSRAVVPVGGRRTSRGGSSIGRFDPSSRTPCGVLTQNGKRRAESPTSHPHSKRRVATLHGQPRFAGPVRAVSKRPENRSRPDCSTCHWSPSEMDHNT
jgi:hypothetical protein